MAIAATTEGGSGGFDMSKSWSQRRMSHLCEKDPLKRSVQKKWFYFGARHFTSRERELVLFRI